MTTAKNVGRINVWPTYDIAREADTAESKYIGRLTVWPTYTEARAHLSHEDEEEGGGGGPEEAPEGFAYLVNAGDEFMLNADGAYILAEVN